MPRRCVILALSFLPSPLQNAMKTQTKKLTALFVAAAFCAAAPAHAKGEVEVLHYWTSGGEAKSVAELKRLLEKEGFGWKDFAVAGGGGENASTVLKTRALSGNPPAAAQIKGPAIQEWGETGALANMDSVAKAGNWDKLLPQVVADVMKYEGNYVAVPVNVHRVNWLWANKAVLNKAGVAVPKTWDEFFVAADKIKKAGYMPVAHGGQAWQDATVFESIVLAVGGADFYNRAFAGLDSDALGGATMQKAFEVFRKYQQLVDANAAGRDWNLATAMVIEGKAAFQIMGDWAKGEFSAAGKKPGADYECVAVPGTAEDYTFNIDSFILFGQKDADNRKAQSAFARLIMEPEFQEVFNLNKGSIPVRPGVPLGKFDSCAKLSVSDFAATAKSGGLVPSMAHGMSTFPGPQGAIYDTVTEFFNSKQSAAAAAKALAAAVRAAQ